MLSLSETVLMLEVLTENVRDDLFGDVLVEEMTPFQKAQMNRRQTIAAHSPRPAKQSTFYKHAVRAIFSKLRKSGESFKGAAKGGQLIAQYMLKKNGYASGHPSGNFSLTSKGKSQNWKHTKEPKNVLTKKARAYDYIMGIQRRKKQMQQAVKAKAASAG